MSLSPKAFDMPHATADDTNYAALPLEGRDAFTGSRVTFYENAVLTIDGVSSTVTDVSVSFSDDATEQCAPLPIEGWDAFIRADDVADLSDKLSPDLLKKTIANLDVDPFRAPPLIMSPRLARACREAFPGVDVVETERLLCDEFTRHRDRPLWLRRGQRRAKGKAKRAKMRAARYAARWEQAHSRGEK